MNARSPSRIHRVLVVDDHPLMREGLDLLISGEPDFLLCGTADSVASALAAISRLSPEVVVLDLTLGQEDGIEVLRKLREHHAAVRVLVLSMHDEMLYAERLLAMGAHGYVMKQEPPEVFLAALRKVATGEHFVSTALGSRLFGRLAKLREGAAPRRHGDRLTDREHDVLREVSRGLGTRQIAEALGMSAKTVDSHRRNIREKLGLASAGDLVRYAVKWAEDRE
jgi:DNA-binding NarL/FixJ family response regulator